MTRLDSLTRLSLSLILMAVSSYGVALHVPHSHEAPLRPDHTPRHGFDLAYESVQNCIIWEVVRAGLPRRSPLNVVHYTDLLRGEACRRHGSLQTTPHNHCGKPVASGW